MPHELPAMRNLTGLSEKDTPGSSRGVACNGWIGTKTAFNIAEINDNPAIDDEERKAKLAPLFASIGWEPIYR